MIYVYYSQNFHWLSEADIEKELKLLPCCIRLKNQRYKPLHKKQEHLIGVKLLQHGLKRLHLTSLAISQLRYDLNGRPSISSNVDFNISHTRNIAVCAINFHGKVGIDVEKIRNVDYASFNHYLCSAELESISNAHNPTLEFFKFWTAKESFVKFDGRGMKIPFLDIMVEKNSAFFNENRYVLQYLNIVKNYVIAVCSIQKEDIIVEEANL